MGAEVVYTRSDDTFIPLESRTQLANEHKADLFLSVHANSSPARNSSGVETYYLNFTTSKAAMEVAARENASSQKTVYELKDLLQKIALQDKMDESREFAERIQQGLYAASVKANSRTRNRGVKTGAIRGSDRRIDAVGARRNRFRQQSQGRSVVTSCRDSAEDRRGTL